MEIPKYYEYYKPFLEYIRDGKEHSLNEIKSYMAEYFKIKQSELSEAYSSGANVFSKRVGWASTYLKKAGLINSPARGMLVITEQGLDVLNENPHIIDNKYLMKFESFRNFKGSSNVDDNKLVVEEETKTPDDTFEESYNKINQSLADDVLSEALKISPTAFEQMVIDLLYKMGYGAFENSSSTTPITGDGGIDGIIMEDKLGFSLIYIQAKKWDIQNSVGRPDVQNFVGAISGKGGKGLFVTTSKFTKQAEEYAKSQHIILIDGEKLAKLMIEHNFGVSVKKTFEIKTLDTDMFNDYL